MAFNPVINPTPRRPKARVFFVLAMLMLLLLSGFGVGIIWNAQANAPHPGFPQETDIEIRGGLTLSQITELLEEQSVVRSSFALYLALLRLDENPIIQAGTYRFPAPLTTSEIAQGLLEGAYKSPLARVTFPEGFTLSNMRSYYPESYTPAPESLSEELEGYLFPDTYHITRDMPESDLIALMRATFDEKIAPYETAIAASRFTLDDVVILASIIEREAKDTESKRIVSGILQNRLEINMPLQADATLNYVLDKTSAELTIDDLETDSPFNTYTRTGLPPSPIANPGLDSIEAVLFPEESEYMYYLTAPDGTFHYARTFEEHKENKERYLP